MKEGSKGTCGYYRREKVRRGLITLVMFLIPLIIFFSGYLYYHTRSNALSIVAVPLIFAALLCAMIRNTTVSCRIA